MKPLDSSAVSACLPGDVEAALRIADSFVLQHTGKHLNTLQTVIIRGAWVDQSYQDIAQSAHCSETHVKRVGADLWELLSNVLSEPISKKTIRAVLERRVYELGRTPVRNTPSTLAKAPLNRVDLEYPDGPVRLSSPFYIDRPPIEQHCCEAIEQPGGLIRIRAACQTGKTSLLNRILSHARQQGYHAVSLDLQLVDSAILQDLNRFLQWLCANVARGLQLPLDLDEYWDGIFGSKTSCYDYFRGHLLARLESPLVVALDKLDVIFPYPEVANDFLSLLRSWYEQSRDSELWQKLRLVLVHATDAHAPLSVNQSPFNVGLVVELPEFEAAQIHALADRHGLSWTAAEVEQLMQLVGGHPYLVRLALYQITRENLTLEQLSKLALTEAGPFYRHLQQQFASVKRHPTLAPVLEALRSQESIKLQPFELHQLNRIGLIRIQNGQIQLRCELYHRWLSDLAYDTILHQHH